MPDAGAIRAPINDCVQNQSARTAPATRKRKSRPRRWLEFSASVMARCLSPAHIRLFVERSLGHLQRQSARSAKIKFPGAEIRERLDAQELVLARPPQRGQVAFSQFLEAFFQLRLSQRVQNHEALAFFLVGHGGDDKSLFRGTGKFLQQILDLDVRHHFAANFTEAAQAVGDANESILVHPRDIPGVVPASRRTSAVFSGLLRYPRMMFGPRTSSRPGTSPPTGC